MTKLLPTRLRTVGATTLLALSVLYPTIYLHELAHAATAFTLGCKGDWHSVDMSPVLVWSFGGDIDYACLALGPAWATAAVDGAGTAANLAMMLVFWSLAAMMARAPALALWPYAAATTNYVEAFSYLVANTAIPRSDMIAVLAYSKIPNLAVAAVAALAAVAIGRPLFAAFAQCASRFAPPMQVRRMIALAALFVAAGMIGARLPLTDAAAPTASQSETRTNQ
jgi:hypothetical protein